MTGGNRVTVAGSGFTGATGVSFGPAAASGLSVTSDTELTVTSPPAQVACSLPNRHRHHPGGPLYILRQPASSPTRQPDSRPW